MAVSLDDGSKDRRARAKRLILPTRDFVLRDHGDGDDVSSDSPLLKELGEVASKERRLEIERKQSSALHVSNLLWFERKKEGFVAGHHGDGWGYNFRARVGPRFQIDPSSLPSPCGGARTLSDDGGDSSCDDEGSLEGCDDVGDDGNQSIAQTTLGQREPSAGVRHHHHKDSFIAQPTKKRYRDAKGC